MSMLTLPYGTDSDVHLSSKKAIGTLESMYNLAFHPDLGFTEEQVRN